MNKLYKLKFKNKNIRFLKNSKIDSSTVLNGNNSIGESNIIYNSKIGFGTYTGSNVSFINVVIGKYCSIGSNIKNIVGRHPSNTFVSTHPAFFSTGKAAGFTFSSKQLFEEKVTLYDDVLVEIGNDVWIGDNVTILDNVKIANGAIIGTNSLVTKNIPPYSINVGIPCKTIKYRFNEDEINFLLENKWWDKDFEWLKVNSSLFSDITLYIDEVMKINP